MIVRQEDVTDSESFQLSREVAKKIEQELTYPGQIKVTVIRESRYIEGLRQMKVLYMAISWESRGGAHMAQILPRLSPSARSDVVVGNGENRLAVWNPPELAGELFA